MIIIINVGGLLCVLSRSYHIQMGLCRLLCVRGRRKCLSWWSWPSRRKLYAETHWNWFFQKTMRFAASVKEIGDCAHGFPYTATGENGFVQPPLTELAPKRLRNGKPLVWSISSSRWAILPMPIHLRTGPLESVVTCRWSSHQSLYIQSFKRLPISISTKHQHAVVFLSRVVSESPIVEQGRSKQSRSIL